MKLLSTRTASALLTVLLTSLLAACSPKAPVAEEPRPVRVTRAIASDAQGITTYAAEIRPRFETDMSFRLAGKILTRNVDLGATVKKGQVLARLDAQDANLNVAASRATLAAADSDVEYAKAELARYEDLLAKKFVSQGVYDQKQNAYKAAAAKRDAARAQAGVSGNQANYTTLTADADGVVTALNAEPGQVVNAGQSVVRVARLGEKDAVINVAENQLAAVKAQPNAKIALWANPNKLYSGKVREIAASADAATRTYTVKLTLLDGDDALRWGMSANVGFTGNDAEANGSAKRMIVLPMTALTQTDDKAGAKPAVWVVGADNKVKLMPVEIGRFGEAGVTVLAGLSGGETVVTAGVHKLQSGQAVKPLVDNGLGPVATSAGGAVAVPPVVPVAQADTQPTKKANN